MKNYLSIICVFILTLTVSCKKQGVTHEDPVYETEINSTTLDEDATLYGLVTDEQGNPISDVVVTDGFFSRATDQNGVYQIKRHKKAKFVSYSTPAEYEIGVDAENYPVYYERLNSLEKKIRKDFVLERGTFEENFTLVCIGDPQCRNPNEVNRYKTETIVDINSTVPSYQNVYGITLGDIIFDSPELWGEMRTSMANQGIPFFQTIGNHDHLETAPNDEKAAEGYQAVFGPTDYSFNRGNVHIVCMDNVMYTGRQEYTGGFTANQWEWLKEDLSFVPKEKMIVLVCHIPFRNGGSANHNTYRQEVLDLLATYAEAHIMVGHTHYNQNYIHQVGSKKVYEHVHGTASGAWWNSTICADGTPNGYGIYQIVNNSMENWLYKSTGYEESYQLRAYDATHVFGPGGKLTYWFGHSSNLNLSGDGWVIANVWNSDPDWTVSLYQNGVKVSDMQPVSSRDLWASYYHLEVLNKTLGSTFDRTTSHFYRGRLSGEAATADFEIIARDRFGNEYRTDSFSHDYSRIAFY